MRRFWDSGPEYICPDCGQWTEPPHCWYCGLEIGPHPPQVWWLPWVAAILVGVLFLTLGLSFAAIIGVVLGVLLFVGYVRRSGDPS